jgi:hypothetical protein
MTFGAFSWCILFGAFDVGWLVLDDSLLSDQPQPILCRGSLLGYDCYELDPIFSIDLHLLNCFAVETIGDFLQRMDIAAKTLLDQLVSQCPQFGAAFLSGFGHGDAEGSASKPGFRFPMVFETCLLPLHACVRACAPER